jgi:hypothetical protein
MELEQMNYNLKFEVDQLRYDNQQMRGVLDKERQTSEIIRKLYNNALKKTTDTCDQSV